MLNRRTLRIKVMQSLFAFEQCREANRQLASDALVTQFSPNLMAAQVQDKVLLKQQRDKALTLIEKRFSDPNQTSGELDIDNAVSEAFHEFQVRLKKDFEFLKKSTLLDIESISANYYLLLNLFSALADVAKADKETQPRVFANNPIVLAIAQSEALKKESARTVAHWENKMDKVRTWFKEIVKQDEAFKTYCAKPTPTETDHLDILKHILRKQFLSATAMADFFEDQDLHWEEDQDVLKSMVEKSLKSVFANGQLELQKLSMEWEDDKAFVEKLFTNAAWLGDAQKALVGKHTKNWEAERLPLTDRVILYLAIAELIQFPNIPVKVTINEYIELTKRYSTPNSRQFINGILDVIAKELKADGAIKKSGRGLIDNK